MADICHIAKCWNRYNSSITGPIWMKVGWLHPISFTVWLRNVIGLSMKYFYSLK